MTSEFLIRKDRFYSEFQFIYSELYRNENEIFTELLKLMQEAYKARSASLRKKDREALCNMNWYRSAKAQDRLLRMHEKQETLVLSGNFEDPAVLLKAVGKLLEAANRGTELLTLAGIQNLFCIPDTEWQNKTKVHILLRILRIVSEIVCPALLLYGLVPGPTANFTPYFGTPEKPELHLMSDPSLLATIWQTVATHDTRLLENYVNSISHLPENRIFYRTRDEEQGIFWDLDYEYLQVLRMDEEAHKKFLQSYFTGSFKASPAKAHRVRRKENGEWGVRGTIAEFSGDPRIAELVNALFLQLSGIPIPAESKDRAKLLRIRRDSHVFDCGADLWTPGTDNQSTIGIGRYKDGVKFYGLYNFSDQEQVFSLHDPGHYRNELTGKEVEIVNLVRLQPYAYAWLSEG